MEIDVSGAVTLEEFVHWASIDEQIAERLEAAMDTAELRVEMMEKPSHLEIEIEEELRYLDEKKAWLKSEALSRYGEIGGLSHLAKQYPSWRAICRGGKPIAKMR